MSVSRNDPCPCGSGKKYKRCCLPGARPDVPGRSVAPRFRFEHGSYGGPGRGFMPSAICYEQIAPGRWSDHFCLVNPTCPVSSEDEASSAAEADLAGAFASKSQGGSDQNVAEFLRGKGYVRVDGFRRAKEAPESGAPPNGGPAMPLGNSGAEEGPPSVS